MSTGVIVLAPPWPRSGSGNAFAAQAAAYARRGARVFLLLTPLGRGFARHKAGVWQDALAAMRFPGVETLAYPKAGRRRVRSYLQWLLSGCDDTIAISARYAASGKLPGELARFAASARIDLIHANHVFSVPLAQRVARIVHELQGRRPHVLLETHDIQSDAVAAGRRRNPLSRGCDAYEDLLRTELALCAQADTLVHVTRADFDFFAHRLPDQHHEILLPTLDPGNEAELVRRRGVHRPAEFDFVYLGTQHEANLETVRWLLSKVLPRAHPGVRERVRIVGAIGGLLSRRDPGLFARYAPLCIGETPSVLDFYAATKAVLAPAMAGTGASVKLVEALCAGKPILTTSLALRGLPGTEMSGASIEVHDAAADFARAMDRLSAAAAPAPAAQAANAALYDRLFSNERYFADLHAIIGRRTAQTTPSPPRQCSDSFIR
jgi:hypothetical protein